jgi:hypothetical protein
MVKSKEENIIKGRISGLAMEVRVFALFRGLAWCYGSLSCNMKVGATAQVKFRVLPLMKIQGLVLIGCVGLVEDIVLRVETIFRVKT